MMYYITAVMTSLVLIAAWIYSLISHNRELKSKLITDSINEANRLYDEKLRAQNVKVAEEERDYEKAKEDFTNKYGNGTNGSGGPK